MCVGFLCSENVTCVYIMDIVEDKCGFEVGLTLVHFGICVGCIPNQKDRHEMKKKVKM